jgi:OOP family OmpA-OmpF porin
MGDIALLKNILLASALGLSIYALATTASAGHRPQGWYVGVEGGANWVDDASIDIVGVGPVDWDAEFESGWAAFVEVGYRFESSWRLELEAGWRQNEVDCISFGGPCIAGNWGDVSQFTHMLNLVHDIDLSERTALSLGIGLGGNFVEADDTLIPLRDDDDWVFAAQVLVQVSHQLTDRLDFVLSYRFMRSEDPQFQRFAAPAIEFENENHTVSLGLRFDLQADAEPEAPVTSAPPAEPPPAPRQFIVYFGFNKTNLTDGAMLVVKQAAEAARSEGSASILVTGHTDTAGSSAFNQRLSQTRAVTVKKALVAEGIPASAITATGKGKNELEVQTSDHQREPRNRRAVIDIDPAQAAEPASDGPSAAAPEAAPATDEMAVARTPEAPAPAVPTAAPAAAPPTAEAAAPARSRRTGVGEETLAQYRAWIAEARAKHAYSDSEDRMLKVMMCESGGNASIVNPAGPYTGLFQYRTDTWNGAWNTYRAEGIKDAHAQIFATALAWQRGMQRHWGCYSNPH